MVLPIKGEPPCRLQVDPKNALLTLVTEYDTPEPDVAKLKNVWFSTLTLGYEDLAEIVVRVEGNVHGAYGLLATVADGLQIEKLPLAAAVAVGVARHRDVLAGRGALTIEKEVGLFGELLFLEFLIDAIGSGPAVKSWQGPASEEHDFTFESLHVEVKTTSGERRKHVIHGLEQLVPLRGIPLSLLSIQLTRSVAGAGRTLPQLVAQVRKDAGGYRPTVDAMLDSFGWRNDDADLYSTFWTPRSEPRAYAVSSDFPAMTHATVGATVPSFALVSEVSYRVDLTHFEYTSLPDPISGFAQSTESESE